jgi:hypothetical protein
MVLPGTSSEIKPVGNNPGWILAFFHEDDEGWIVETDEPLRFWSADYYIDLRASLPQGLAGGNYEFIIEGMTDQDYAQIAGGGEDKPTVVRLYLYWQDFEGAPGLSLLTPITDAIAELKGPPLNDEYLVAELAITNISRRLGERRYEAIIQASERVYHKLASRRITEADAEALEDDDVWSIIDYLTTEVGVSNDPYPSGNPEDDPPTQSPEVGRKYSNVLRHTARRLERATNAYGRGMMLIRDGYLIAGKRDMSLIWRDKIQKLTVRAGFIEAQSLGKVPIDPTAVDDEATQRRFQLTLKGRPDIKPGMIVEFDAPPEDLADAEGLGWFDLLKTVTVDALPLSDDDFENPRYLYVETVRHEFKRTRGFVTTLSGVVIDDPENIWDEREPPPPTAEPEHAAQGGSSSERASEAIIRQIDRALNERRAAEVGQVRASAVSTAADENALTSRIWLGLLSRDAQDAPANVLPFADPPNARLPRVPYATPYAWGKTGLIIPRYPGMRVLLVHRNAEDDDPIDVGAIHNPANFENSTVAAGDWWLILPVGVDESARSTATDDTTDIEDHTGAVTHDLIDADGNRIINTAELTLRVGRESLINAGERPERPADEDSLTIEHVDGAASIIIAADGAITLQAHNGDASVTMNADGSVTINAKQLDISATDGDINMEASGDINLNASNVNVSVSGNMDVTS